MSDEQQCVWNMEGACNGSVERRAMFNAQITVPICDKHFHDHVVVIALHSAGYDSEEIMAQTGEWREQEVVKRGIDLSTVKP